MPSTIIERPRGTTRSQMKLSFPSGRPKPEQQEIIAGNKYDIVLACQPDAADSHDLYDSIVKLVEGRGLRIYSPHSDVKRGHTVQDATRFAIREAIPRTKGVLLHLTTVAPEIQKMFEATYQNSRPFLIFHSIEIEPFSHGTAQLIRSSPLYKGELTYEDNEDALENIEKGLPELLGYPQNL